MSKHRGVIPETQRVQISVAVQVPKYRKVRLTREFLQACITHRLDTGEDVPGVTISAVIWEKNIDTPIYRRHEYKGAVAIDSALLALARIRSLIPNVNHIQQVRAGEGEDE